MTLLEKVKSRLSFAYVVALVVAINGVGLMLPVVRHMLALTVANGGVFDAWKDALNLLALLEIPGFVVGFLLVLMSFGLALKSRMSWFFSLLLLISAVCIIFFIVKIPNSLAYYSLFSIALLAFYWRGFDHHSLATGSFFAIVSIASLIVYSMLGTLYLGDQFTRLSMI